VGARKRAFKLRSAGDALCWQVLLHGFQRSREPSTEHRSRLTDDEGRIQNDPTAEISVAFDPPHQRLFVDVERAFTRILSCAFA
jgi:hypothetical protein